MKKKSNITELEVPKNIYSDNNQQSNQLEVRKSLLHSSSNRPPQIIRGEGKLVPHNGTQSNVMLVIMVNGEIAERIIYYNNNFMDADSNLYEIYEPLNDVAREMFAKLASGNINEGALNQGITSYQTSTTSPAASSTSGGQKGSTINIKKQDLTNPEVQKGLSGIKNANINVTEDEEGVLNPSNFHYLSEVKDETGQISKPFNINGKNYQMCRAKSSDGEKVTAVYALDEMDESGKNKIYGLDEFEQIAKKFVDESEKTTEESVEEPVKTEKKEEVTKENPNFAGYKHFIVNSKTGKARKFKSIEELAKATMSEDEKYMGIKEFKKFVDESLFGKRNLKEQPTAATPAPAAGTPVENSAVTNMFKMIDRAVPSTAYQNIKQNPAAQYSAIADWIERIGVPQNKLNDIVSFIKNSVQKQQANPPAAAPVASTTTTTTAAPVNEVRVIKTIKKKDII